LRFLWSVGYGRDRPPMAMKAQVELCGAANPGREPAFQPAQPRGARLGPAESGSAGWIARPTTNDISEPWFFERQTPTDRLPHVPSASILVLSLSLLCLTLAPLFAQDIKIPPGLGAHATEKVEVTLDSNLL